MKIINFGIAIIYWGSLRVIINEYIATLNNTALNNVAVPFRVHAFTQRCCGKRTGRHMLAYDFLIVKLSWVQFTIIVKEAVF